MQFAKRIFMFLAVNLLVMLMLGIVFFVAMMFFPGLRQSGLAQLVVLSGVFGMGGALISLALSRVLAKWMQGVKVIDPANASGDTAWLLQTVHRLAERTGITTMPEVGIYDSPEINAFCTGPTKNRSLVAVSTGLLNRMSHDEVEGVLAHELSHAGNGDMVTLTLVSGVVNSFVLFISFIVTNIVMSALRGKDNERGGGFLDYMVRQIVFSTVQVAVGLLASMAILFPFSRWREYRADAGGAKLVGKRKMISALEALQDNFRLPKPPADASPAFATMKIGSLNRNVLFSTHPSLEDRIARLREMPLVD